MKTRTCLNSISVGRCQPAVMLAAKPVGKRPAIACDMRTVTARCGSATLSTGVIATSAPTAARLIAPGVACG